MSEKFVEITVTIERTYLVPMIDAKRTAINGWTVDEVIKDWFTDYDINRHHASRDTHRLGGGETITRVVHSGRTDA